VIRTDTTRGLLALIIVFSGFLSAGGVLALELAYNTPAYDVSLIEATGVPNDKVVPWLLPPAEPSLPGILVADRSLLESLESAGAKTRVLGEYVASGFYYFVNGPFFVSEMTLSSEAKIIWQNGDNYLVYADENIGDRLTGLGFEIQLLFPFEKSLAAITPVFSAPVLSSLARSYSPIENYYISLMVQSVSGNDILGHLNSLTGKEPINVPSGPDTLKTRYSYSPHCAKAAEYVYGQFDSLGLSVAYDSYLGTSLRAVAFIGQEGYAAGDNGVIFHSTDGGTSWEKQYWRSTPTLWKASFIAADSGWICGSRGCVLRTFDGGATWDSLGHPNLNFLYGVKFVNSMVGWVCGGNGTLRKTTDGGLVWVLKTSGSPQTLYDVEFTDLQNGWMVGGNGEILRSSNGGESWSRQTSNTSSVLYDACFVDSLRGWTVGTGGTILHTSNGGSTWEAQSSGVINTLQSVCFVDSLHGWAVGTVGIVLHTSDGGTHWTIQNSGMQSTLWSVCFIDSLDGWSVGVASNIRTTNGGVDWSSLNDSFPDRWRNVVATLTGSKNPAKTYIVCAHYDSYASIDPMVNAPGADDNATGTSLVLEAARVLKEFAFSYSIRFICFSGEEQGLLGSAYYAGEAASRGDDIAGVLNFDMVGWGTPNAYLIGNSSSQWLVDYCIAVRDTFVPELALTKLLNSSMRSSDHASFWDKGYSAFCGIETDYGINPYYHSARDTVGNINLSFTTNVTKLAVASLASLAELDTSLVSLPPQALPSLAIYLGTSFPNPFNPHTNIPFTLPATKEPTNYVLAIFDPAGRIVKILDEGRTGTTGVEKTSVWDGSDEAGRPVSSGVYLCHLRCGDESRARKVVLLR
jgi:photosystem II stability/assembly factor-like uncharacterized protein